MREAKQKQKKKLRHETKLKTLITERKREVFYAQRDTRDFFL